MKGRTYVREWSHDVLDESKVFIYFQNFEFLHGTYGYIPKDSRNFMIYFSSGVSAKRGEAVVKSKQGRQICLGEAFELMNDDEKKLFMDELDVLCNNLQGLGLI